MMDQRQRQGQLGATFVPGGADDFYMPNEVVSPAPQRSVSFRLFGGLLYAMEDVY